MKRTAIVFLMGLLAIFGLIGWAGAEETETVAPSSPADPYEEFEDWDSVVYHMISNKPIVEPLLVNGQPIVNLTRTQPVKPTPTDQVVLKDKKTVPGN